MDRPFSSSTNQFPLHGLSNEALSSFLSSVLSSSASTSSSSTATATTAQRHCITVVCNTCSATIAPDGTSLLVCTACGSVAYCSKEHQQADWPRHKALCRSLSSRSCTVASPASSTTSTTRSSGIVSDAGSSIAAAAKPAVTTASTTADYSNLMLPPALLANPAALAALLSQATSTSGGQPTTVTTHPPQMHTPQPATVPSSLMTSMSLESLLSSISNNSTSLQSSGQPLLDPDVLSALASHSSFLLPSTSSYTPTPSLSSMQSTTPLFPPLIGSLSSLGIDASSLSSLPGFQQANGFPSQHALPPLKATQHQQQQSSQPSTFIDYTKQPDASQFIAAALAAASTSGSSTSSVISAPQPSPYPKVIVPGGPERLKAIPRGRRADSPSSVISAAPSGGINGQVAPSATPPFAVPTASASATATKRSAAGLPTTSQSVTGSPVVVDKHAISSRKRVTPSPPDARFPQRGKRMPQAGLVVKLDEEDDDIQVVSQTINRKYRDHTKNVIYNVTLREHQQNLAERGLTVSIHQAMVLRLRYMAEHVIRSLTEFGWAVVDNFLGAEHVKFAAKEMEKLYEKGLFTAGQLMEGAKAKKRESTSVKEIRSDFIYWYDGCDPRAENAVTLRLLISMIDSLVCHFDNRFEGHEIGGRSRAMLAIYPGNTTRYVKHVDNPNGDGRLITCIYYPNADWDLEKHGGALRLYPESCSTAMEVDPQADRLVFFWSDRRNPHEVMPVFRHRFAVTIWYMDKNERLKALKAKADAETAHVHPMDTTQENSMRGITFKQIKSESVDEEEMAAAIVTHHQPARLPPARGAAAAALRPSHSSAPEMGTSASGTSLTANDSGLGPELLLHPSLSRSQYSLHQGSAGGALPPLVAVASSAEAVAVARSLPRSTASAVAEEEEEEVDDESNMICLPSGGTGDADYQI